MGEISDEIKEYLMLLRKKVGKVFVRGHLQIRKTIVLIVVYYLATFCPFPWPSETLESM